MGKYKGNLKLLKGWLSYLSVFLISGCVTIAEIPDQSFKPSNKLSLVLGRLEIIKDGQPVLINRAILRAKTLSLPEKLLPNEKKDEEYFIRILREDGYFVTALPPGKYVVSAITPYNIFERIFKGSDSLDLIGEKPAFITFDVIHGNAIYIGTIKAIMSTEVIKETVTVPKYIIPVFIPGYPGLPDIRIGQEQKLIERKYTRIENWQIKNEFDEARKVFTALYPNQTEPIERPCELR